MIGLFYTSLTLFIYFIPGLHYYLSALFLPEHSKSTFTAFSFHNHVVPADFKEGTENEFPATNILLLSIDHTPLSQA